MAEVSFAEGQNDDAVRRTYVGICSNIGRIIGCVVLADTWQQTRSSRWRLLGQAEPSVKHGLTSKIKMSVGPLTQSHTGTQNTHTHTHVGT